MRCAIPLFAMMLAFASPAHAQIKAPSCEAVAAISMVARADPIEMIFGAPATKMTLSDFEQAIDIVDVCVDEIEARPDDVPGLFVYERKRPQIVALSLLLEDLKIYRHRQSRRESQSTVVR